MPAYSPVGRSASALGTWCLVVVLLSNAFTASLVGDPAHGTSPTGPVATWTVLPGLRDTFEGLAAGEAGEPPRAVGAMVRSIGGPAPPLDHSGASLPSSLAGTDWLTYLHDDQRTGANPNGTAFTDPGVANLSLAWSHAINDSVMGSLIVANGTVFVGSRNGYLLAYDARTGTALGPTTVPSWTPPYLGQTFYSTCRGDNGTQSPQPGLTATPTLRNGRIYEDAGVPQFDTIALNGTVLSRVDVGNRSNSPWYYDYGWASPLLYRGSAYVGTAALCEYNNADPNSMDWKYVQGQLLELNLSNGTIVHVFNVTRGASLADVGGSIWSTPSVDPRTNIVWVTTGNENASGQTPSNAEYPRSVVALNASTLQVLGSCQVGYVGADDDFGAGPTLFHGSHGARYVGAINKDGTFYAYNASDPTGGSCNGGAAPSLRLVWSDTFCTAGGSGPLAPAAFDGTDLFVASSGCGNWSGHVDELDPDTGHILWDHTLADPPAIATGGLAYSNGLLFVTANNDSTGSAAGTGELQVLNASSGALLFERFFNTSIAAGAVLAEGSVFLGLGNFTNTGTGYVDALRVLPPVAVATVDLSASPGYCGALQIGGQDYSLPGAPQLREGNYTLAAPSCTPTLSFGRWSTTGAVTVDNASAATTTLRIGGNGSLAMEYYGPLRIAIQPATGGRVSIDGVDYRDGAEVNLSLGAHPLRAIPTPWSAFVSWTLVGGLQVISNATLEVAMAGWLTATFRAVPYATVRLLPTSCGSVSVDGRSVTSGMTVPIGGGAPAAAASTVVAPNCTAAGELFHRWQVTGNFTVGNVTATNTTLTGIGNGTLTAVYVAGYPVEWSVEPVGAAVIYLNGTPVPTNGSRLLAAGTYGITAMLTADRTGAEMTWNTTGSVEVSGATLTVGGPGAVRLSVSGPSVSNGTAPPWGSGSWTWVLLGAGGAALVALGLVVRLRRRRARST